MENGREMSKDQIGFKNGKFWTMDDELNVLSHTSSTEGLFKLEVHIRCIYIVTT